MIRHDVGGDGGGGGGGGGIDGRLGEGGGGVPRAANRPLVLVLGGGVVHGAWGGQHSSPLDRKLDPLPLPPLAAPSQRDPMLGGHVEVCGPEPHTSRVAAQVEQGQRSRTDALRDWAEGLAGERAPGLGAPSLAIPPPPTFDFAVPVSLAPDEAAENPLKGHVRVRRAGEQGLVPCACAGGIAAAVGGAGAPAAGRRCFKCPACKKKTKKIFFTFTNNICEVNI